MSRPRIGFVINSLVEGGAERVLQTLSNWLVPRGFDVYLILLDSGVSVYSFRTEVTIITLRSSALAKGIGKLLFLPIQAFELAMVIKKLQLGGVMSLLVRANLAHIFTQYFGNIRTINISERSIIDSIYPPVGLKNRAMRLIVAHFYKKAPKVVAISNGVKRGLVRFGLDPSRVEVIYNPQDFDRILSNANRLPLPMERRDRYRLVTSGRLVDLKDHQTLLKAASIVNRLVPVDVVLIGDGPERSNLEHLASELGIRDIVTITGWVSDPFSIMESGDVFILTSKFEGFGNVLVEAMALGLPIISTDCPGGPREILVDGEYGILVPVEDPNALATAILSLLRDLARRRELSRKGIARSKVYSVDNVVQEYLSVLLPEC